MKREALRAVADSMQAGNICPSCQKGIVAGQEIVSCLNCGAMNHSGCWDATGCGSYHCRPAGSFLGNTPPDFVITKNEVAQAVPLPRGRMHTTESLAREVGTAPTRLSGVALGGLVIATICFGFLLAFGWGVDPESELYLPSFLAVLLSGTAAVIVSAIGLMIVQTNRQLTGGGYALSGVLLASLSMGVGIFSLSLQESEEGQLMAPVRFEAGKVKDFIARADDRIRGPLMSNVHVSARQGYAGESQGSGVILKTTPNAIYILSNLHVVTAGKLVRDLETLKKGPRIVMTFFNGEKRIAEPIWLAPSGIDLVLLQTPEVKGIQSSSKVQSLRLLAIGQKVFAIGNPMGLNWSYTEGVISAIRSQQFGSHELPVIQMQTPLNPGNSGGGLYDQDGFLVGINTWIYAKSKSEGLNFSISVDGLLKVLDPGLKQTLALETPPPEAGGKHDGQAEAPPGRLQ